MANLDFSTFADPVPLPRASPRRPAVLDFSAGADPVDDAAPAALDFSDRAEPVDAADAGIGDYLVEGGKGFVRGAAGLAGTALQGVAADYAAIRQYANDLDRSKLELMDRIDAGEALPPYLDPGPNPFRPYAKMTKAERSAYRKTIEDGVRAYIPTDVAQTPLYKAGEAVTAGGAELAPVTPGWEGSVTTTLTEGLGSLGGGVLATILGGPVAAGAVFTAAGSGEAAQRAIAFDKAEKAAGRPGLTQEQIITAGFLGIGPGATDILPVETLLGGLKVPTPFRKPLARAIARIGGQAFIEGVQEGGQQFLQNLIARETYDPDQPLGEGVGVNTAAGAGVGGIAQGIVEALVPGRMRGGTRPAAQPEAAPIPGAPAAVPEGSVPAETLYPAPAEAVQPEAAAPAPVDEALPPADVTIPEVVVTPEDPGRAAAPDWWRAEADAAVADYRKTLEDHGVTGPALDKLTEVYRQSLARSAAERLAAAEEAKAQGVAVPAPIAAPVPAPAAAPASVTGPIPPAGEPPPATRDEPAAVTNGDDLAAATSVPRPEPTEAQKEAGNYAKHHLTVQGLPVSIENPKGSMRSGIDSDGNPWSVEMPAAYGYVKRSAGADGDQVDVYVGDAPESDRVFVVDQKDAVTGAFDEHKAMLGFPDRRTAVQTYRSAFSDGKGGRRIGAITEMTVDEFKRWLREGDTTRPLGMKVVPVTARKPVTRPPATTSLSPARVPPSPRAKVAKPSAPRPVSLVRFLKARGGIREESGELKAMGLHRRFPGLVNNRAGLSHDYAREAAAEAGYFDHLYGTRERAIAESTPADFRAMLPDGDKAFPASDQALIDDEERVRAGERAKDRDAAVEQEIRDFMAEHGVTDLDDELTRRAADMISSAAETDIGAAVERAAIQIENERPYHDDPALLYEGVPVSEEPEPRGLPEGRELPVEAGEAEPEARDGDQGGREELPRDREDEGSQRLASVKVEPAAPTTASWVIRRKSDGEVQFETFDRKKVEALNTAKYEAVPIGDYLAEVNRKIKPEGEETLGSTVPRKPAERFEAGRALSKEERKKVLATLVDVYKRARLDKEMVGVDRNGNEIWRYPHSPDLFEKSDITGAMVRYFVRLPDGRIAHPTELFPDYTERDINAEMRRRQAAARESRDQVKRRTEKEQQFDSINAAARYWDQRSEASKKESAGGWATISPAANRIAYTKDAKFVLLPKQYLDDGQFIEALADAGWKEVTSTTEEPGAEGKPQTVLPGAGRISDKALAERKAAAPLKAKAPQKPADEGLFSDEKDQPSLLSAAPRASAIDTPEFRRWFGNSKVVDENGKPLVVYHGSSSRRRIRAFDKGKIGSANDEGFYGRGFYFTPDREMADAYGDRRTVEAVYLSIQKPFMWDLRTPAAEKATIAAAEALLPRREALVTTTGIHHLYRKAWDAALKQAGYDGVIDWQRGEIVVFEPTQIKSAANRGTFDANDPSILAKSDPRPRTILDAKARRILEARLRSRVKSIAGKNVKVWTFDTISAEGAGDTGYREGMGRFAEAAGVGLSATAGGSATMHPDGTAIIRLALADPLFDPGSTAYHEAYHRVEAQLMTDAEFAVMNRANNMATVRRAAALELGLSDAAAAELPGYEARAIAFERYARLRDEGRPISGLNLPALVARLFDTIRRLLADVRRVLTGLGYTRFEDIFEDVYQGKMVEREPGFRSLTAAEDETLGSTIPHNNETDPFASGGADARRRAMKAGFGLQPVDRLIRIPFDLFGGLNEKGEWAPGLRLFKKAGELVTSAKFSASGRFAWANPIVERARAGLVDRYGLDAAYVERDRQRGLDEARIMGEVPEMMAMLKSGNIAGPEAKVLHAILTGERTADADWAALAEPIRAAVDHMGEEAVELGLISAETFERNRGAYLHRVYLKHETDQPGLARWASQLMTSRRKRIIGEEFKGRGLWQAVSPQHLGRSTMPEKGAKVRILDRMAPADGTLADETRKPAERAYLSADRPVPEKYAGWTDRGVWEVRGEKNGQAVLWRDFTRAERERMGEIIDARYAIAKTWTLMAHDLATGRFYRDIARNADWATEIEPRAGTWKDANDYRRFWADPTVEWVLVPDSLISKSRTRRYGALAGKWLRAEIWRDITEVEQMQRSGLWKSLLTQWKLSKTARSPVVHLNNVMSNMVLMDLADVRSSDLAKAVRSLVRRDEVYREAADNGAFGADMVSVEIRRNILQPLLEEIETEMRAGPDGIARQTRVLTRLSGAIWGGVKALDRKMVDLYRTEDEVFRLATFIRRRGQGISAKDAALEAKDQFLDYDIRAPWVNAARRTVLPFIAYTYRAAPLVAKAVMTRPWKLAKYYALAQAANALAYAILPGDEDKERRSMREEEQGYTWIGAPRKLRLPWADHWGNPMFLDVRRWIPAGDIFDLNQNSLSDVLPIPVPAPFQFGGPLMMGFELVLNKQAFTGKEIVNTLTDDWWDKTAKVSDWAWKSWMPSAAWVPGSWYWTKIGNAMAGVRDWQGKPYDVGTAALSSLGVKVAPQDVEAAFALRAFEFEKIERELKMQLTRLGKDRARGLLSQRQYERERDRVIEKGKNLMIRRREVFVGSD